MRDIVATIQAHQDEAIRASARGVTEITGGPGTGKTVVALHRAAYLLYSDRRRFESGGILVVGPSGAYTAYIERVLPSLGEESVILRALGDVLDVVHTERLDPPAVARTKGSTRIRPLLSAPRPAAACPVPRPSSAPWSPVARCASRRASSTASARRSCASTSATRPRPPPRTPSARPPGPRLGVTGDRDAKAEFLDKWEDHLDVEAFMQVWWPQVDPREVLLWLADPELVRRHARGTLSERRGRAAGRLVPPRPRDRHLVGGRRRAHRRHRRARSARCRRRRRRSAASTRSRSSRTSPSTASPRCSRSSAPARDAGAPARRPTRASKLLAGRIGKPDEYAHVLVDEAQDLSPMQWRMIGRRGRYASWTVVGDAAQASWPDAAEAAAAREEAFGSQARQQFHMDTNYRNAREIFDYAAEVVRREVPDADIPQAVRETGIEPVEARSTPTPSASVRAAVEALLAQVEGAIAVITPSTHADRLAPCRRARRGARPGHRPDVDEGPRVRRDRRRRPRRDHARVTRRGAGALRRPDPRGAPDDRPVADRVGRSPR